MENALIIFVQNTEKGKVKSRLAEDLGDEKCLEVYKYLLQYTRDITISCKYGLFVFYSRYLHIGDVFDDNIYSKHVQEGNNTGEKMLNAFKKTFDLGCKKVCLIGSNCYELQPEYLNEAFEKLQKCQVVIGPAKDGGYYLLGLKEVYPDLFYNKDWETSTLLDDTFENINELKLTCGELKLLNDIDTIEDILETDILTKLEEDTR